MIEERLLWVYFMIFDSCHTVGGQRKKKKNYTVHCCTTYEYTRYVVVCTCHVISAAALCVATAVYRCVAAATVLPLAVADRHRAPDGQICCCGPWHLIPVFSFSSFKHDLYLRANAVYHLVTAPQGGTQKDTLTFAYDSPR